MREDWPAFSRRLPADLALVLTFFTRLPVPVPAPRGSFAEALWAAPLAGFAVALAGGLAYAIAHGVGVPPLPGALLALAATLIVTGCLHEDGLADVADGFGGGKTIEHKLQIMKDSRIGTFGAAALLLSLMLRTTALAETASPGGVLVALLAAHGASRALLPLFLRVTPPARSDGLGTGVGVIGPETSYVALGLGALGLLALGLSAALLAAILLAALFLAVRLLALKQIGGQTGDVCGALQQTAEILVLLIAAAALS